MEEKEQKNDNVMNYIFVQLLEDIDRIKNDIYGDNEEESINFRLSIIEVNHKKIEELNNRINLLEHEDKKSRIKIVILLIILIFMSLISSAPKLINILETLAKLI